MDETEYTIEEEEEKEVKPIKAAYQIDSGLPQHEQEKQRMVN